MTTEKAGGLVVIDLAWLEATGCYSGIEEVCEVQEVKKKELMWIPSGNDKITITLPKGIKADFGIRVFVEKNKEVKQK